MSRQIFARGVRSRARIVLVSLTLALVAIGCGDEVSAPAIDSGNNFVTLPDGMRLAIPAGATYYYSHIEVTGALSATGLATAPESELVIGRIDWSLCNPRAAQIQFADATSVEHQYTWRIPTLVTTPLAGINILGIFAGGGTLEGGLRLDLDNGQPGDNGVNVWRVANGCTGDWVSIYGYTN